MALTYAILYVMIHLPNVSNTIVWYFGIHVIKHVILYSDLLNPTTSQLL